jgi:4-hydroxy-tetrahydrodipicolinate synthase
VTDAPALTGLWPPVTTPFADDGGVDFGKLVKHSQALLDEGATGLAILGTTSEANSLTLDERRRAIDAHVEAGIPAAKLMPGTGACAIDDVVTLSRHAGDLGAAAVLLVPPFFYKGVADDGLFAFMARVIEKAGAKVPRIMLYHIPPMAAVGWSIPLIARLREAFPGLIVGLTDSSGDKENTRALIEAFDDFAVFPGAEVYLKEALDWGARGCISATANVNARAIVRLLGNKDAPDALDQQAALNAARIAIQSRGLIPSIKAVLSMRYRDDAWANVRPPLVPASAQTRAELKADPALAALVA